MLQTIQAKAEATAQTRATKEKETPSEDLAGGLNTFFAQFMAAMPTQAAAAGVAPAASAGDDARAATTSRQEVQDRTDARALQQDRDDAAAADAREAVKPKATAPERAVAPKAAPDPAPVALAANPDQPQAQAQATPDSGAPADVAAGKPQMAPAQAPNQTEAASLTAPADAAAAGSAPVAATATPAAGTAAPASGTAVPAAGTAAPTAPAPNAPAPETITAAKAQATLEQASPGLRVQFQFGEQTATQPTSKPALSEFLNQIKVELQSPSFAGVGSGSGEPAAPAATATPQLLPALQAPLPTELQAAFLPLDQPLKEGAPAAASLQSTPTPSEVVGAGAALGANGSVRVTPTTQAAPTAPPRRETPMAQVESTVKWLIKNKDQSAELQLHPEALGRVQIKLKVEGTEVHAKLWASEASAVPVLQEHRAFLEAALKAQGLTLGSFDLQHGHQSDQAPLPNSEPALPALVAGTALAATGQEAPAPLTPGPEGAHRIEFVA
jgi:flagellar hook-length control protein FliK